MKWLIAPGAVAGAIGALYAMQRVVGRIMDDLPAPPAKPELDIEASNKGSRLSERTKRRSPR